MSTDFLLFQPRLVEEAVFMALREAPQRERLQRQRDRLYRIADPELRDRTFEEFHRSLFIHFRLADPITKALSEQPFIIDETSRAVVCAAGGKEEGAELFVGSEAGATPKDNRTVRILLKPQSLLDPEPLLTLLRHEMFHIADMLDPAFGYQPSLPPADGGQAHDRLLSERYRALWDATIDGRMVRRRWLCDSARDKHLEELERVFPMLRDLARKITELFFDREPHTHAELAAFAIDPPLAIGLAHQRDASGSRCPLCVLPTHAFVAEPQSLEEEVLAAIRRDFPQWQPELGICLQCADLYRARGVTGSADPLRNAHLNPSVE